VNLLGPKHVAGPAMVVAGAMVLCTLVLVVCAMVQIEWGKLDLGSMWHQPLDLWRAFVAVVLALSGVEAISNLTGVMKQPVTKTAGRAIWVVAIEVAVLNILLGIAMVAAAPGRDEHTEDMLAFMAGLYVGPWFEVVVRIVAGVLLLSAANTAIGAIVGTLYVMSRDGELPAFFQKLNAFGTPWVGAVVGGVVPAVVLMFVSDLRTLAALYAIGIVGAVAINTGLCAYHPRLRRAWRKVLMGGISFLLAGVWITLAITKLPALLFVTLIMVVGLSARQFTRWKASRSRKPTLLRRAIMEQLTPEALGKRRLLLATAGGTQLAEPAMQMAAREDCSLVVCFVREVNLSFKVDERSLTLDTDPAADDLFTRFLELGHQYNVPVIPVYDTGPNSPEMIAEMAAIHGVEKVLIGSSRRGSLHQIIKGSFQRKIESLLPPETRVVVVTSATV
jgi:nucleotide-binding universal stress UspA family protein